MDEVIVKIVIAMAVVAISWLIYYLRSRRHIQRQSQRCEQASGSPEQSVEVRDSPNIVANNFRHIHRQWELQLQRWNLPSGFSDRGLKVQNFLTYVNASISKESFTTPYEYIDSGDSTDPNDILNYVRTREIEGTPELLDEFKSIESSEAPLPWPQATNEINQSKNRFRDILPYEYNRVVLSELPLNPHSDYINASHVLALDPTMRFIAAMTPLGVTVNDFWRMIWEQDVRVIIMLENFWREGEMYLPEQNSRRFGQIIVTLESSVNKIDFSVSKFTVTKLQTSEKREIAHFQYLGWPDGGFPNDLIVLLNFQSLIRRSLVPKTPTLVHCRAGVGRTGMFIAIDSLIEYTEKHDTIDVYGLVKRLQYQRRHMIVNVEQYAFIHAAIALHLKVRNNCVPKSAFHENYHRLVGDTKLQDEFDMLTEFGIKQGNEDRTIALSQENRSKNRDLNIIPVDERRFRFLTGGVNNYINAIYVDGYERRNEYIVTQIPFSHTVQDFWRMVIESKAETVIYIVNMNQKPDMPGFLPILGHPISVNKHKAYLTYIDNPMGSSVDDGVTIITSTVLLDPTDSSDSNSVGTELSVYEVLAGIGQVLDPRIVQYLYKKIGPGRRTSKAPIIVACMNGALYSGQFVACSNMFDMLTAEQIVDIFQTAKDIRACRPQFINTLEEYKSLYDNVQVFIEQE